MPALAQYGLILISCWLIKYQDASGHMLRKILFFIICLKVFISVNGLNIYTNDQIDLLLSSEQKGSFFRGQAWAINKIEAN